jgi:hypothetical protein
MAVARRTVADLVAASRRATCPYVVRPSSSSFLALVLVVLQYKYSNSDEGFDGHFKSRHGRRRVTHLSVFVLLRIRACPRRATMKGQGRRRRRRRAVERLRTGAPLPPRAIPPLRNKYDAKRDDAYQRLCDVRRRHVPGTPTSRTGAGRTRCWAGGVRCELLRLSASCWWIDVAHAYRRSELRCAI